MNNPNPVTYYPLTQFTQNTGLLTLTDQLTKVDTLSFTGTSNLRRTSTYNLVTRVPFYNLVSYGGRASYSHKLSPRLSLGAGYDFNSLDFGRGEQRSGVQTISYDRGLPDPSQHDDFRMDWTGVHFDENRSPAFPNWLMVC